MIIHYNHILILCTMLIACINNTFEQTVINDVTEKMGTGICDSIPPGSSITGVSVGEKRTLSQSPTADVLEVIVEFDFSFNNQIKHRKTSLVYVKRNLAYRLAALGDCDYAEALGEFLEN